MLQSMLHVFADFWFFVVCWVSSQVWNTVVACEVTGMSVQVQVRVCVCGLRAY